MDVRDRTRRFRSLATRCKSTGRIIDILSIWAAVGEAFGYLLKRRFGSVFKITGVDAAEQYTQPPSFLGKYYDKFLLEDIRKLDFAKMGADVVLACDVLEHIEKQEAIDLVKQVLDLKLLMIVSVPVDEKHWHQDEEYESKNPLEQHRHDWTVSEVENEMGLQLFGRYDAVAVFSNIDDFAKK